MLKFGTGEYFLPVIQDGNKNYFREQLTHEEFCHLLIKKNDNIKTHCKQVVYRAAIAFEDDLRQFYQLEWNKLKYVKTFTIQSESRQDREYYTINLSEFYRIGWNKLVDSQNNTIAHLYCHETGYQIYTEQPIRLTGREACVDVISNNSVIVDDSAKIANHLTIFSNDVLVDVQKDKSIKLGRVDIFCAKSCEIKGKVEISSIQIKAGTFNNQGWLECDGKVRIIAERGTLFNAIRAKQGIDIIALAWAEKKESCMHSPGVIDIAAIDYVTEGDLSTNHFIVRAFNADFHGRVISAENTLINVEQSVVVTGKARFFVGGTVSLNSHIREIIKGNIIYRNNLKVQWQCIEDNEMGVNKLNTSVKASTYNPVVNLYGKNYLDISGTINAKNASLLIASDHKIHFSGNIYHASDFQSHPVLLKAKTLLNDGLLKTNSNLHFKLENDYKQSGSTEAKQLQVQAENCQLLPHAVLQAEQMAIKSTTQIDVQKKSKIESSKHLVLNAKNIRHRGHLKSPLVIMNADRLIYLSGSIQSDVLHLFAPVVVSSMKMKVKEVSVTSVLSVMAGMTWADVITVNSIVNFSPMLTLQSGFRIPNAQTAAATAINITLSLIGILVPGAIAITLPTNLAVNGALRSASIAQAGKNVLSALRKSFNDSSEGWKAVVAINQFVNILASTGLAVLSGFESYHDKITSAVRPHALQTDFMMAGELIASNILGMFAGSVDNSFLSIRPGAFLGTGEFNNNLIAFDFGPRIGLSSVNYNVIDIDAAYRATLGPSSFSSIYDLNAGQSVSPLGVMVTTRRMDMTPIMDIPHYGLNAQFQELNVLRPTSFTHSNLQGNEIRNHNHLSLDSSSVRGHIINESNSDFLAVGSYLQSNVSNQNSATYTAIKTSHKGDISNDKSATFTATNSNMQGNHLTNAGEFKADHSHIGHTITNQSTATFDAKDCIVQDGSVNYGQMHLVGCYVVGNINNLSLAQFTAIGTYFKGHVFDNNGLALFAGCQKEFDLSDNSGKEQLINTNDNSHVIRDHAGGVRMSDGCHINTSDMIVDRGATQDHRASDIKAGQINNGGNLNAFGGQTTAGVVNNSGTMTSYQQQNNFGALNTSGLIHDRSGENTIGTLNNMGTLIQQNMQNNIDTGINHGQVTSDHSNFNVNHFQGHWVGRDIKAHDSTIYTPLSLRQQLNELSRNLNPDELRQLSITYSFLEIENLLGFNNKNFIHQNLFRFMPNQFSFQHSATPHRTSPPIPQWDTQLVDGVIQHTSQQAGVLDDLTFNSLLPLGFYAPHMRVKNNMVCTSDLFIRSTAGLLDLNDAYIYSFGNGDYSGQTGVSLDRTVVLSDDKINMTTKGKIQGIGAKVIGTNDVTLTGDQGVDIKPEIKQASSSDSHWRWHGLHSGMQHTKETHDYISLASAVVSLNGQVNFNSSAGVHISSTTLKGAKGVNFNAPNDKILIDGIKLTATRTSSFSGLTGYSHSFQYIEATSPSLIQGAGFQAHSHVPIIIRDTILDVPNGAVTLDAPDVLIEQTINHNHYRTFNAGFGIHVGSWNLLGISNNGMETAINMTNELNAFITAARTSDLPLSKVCENFFKANILNKVLSAQVSFGFGYTKGDYETLNTCVIKAKQFNVNSKVLNILNSVEMDVNNMSTTAKDVTIGGAALHKNSSQWGIKVGVNVGMDGVGSPSVSYQDQHYSGTHHVMAKPHIKNFNGNLDNLHLQDAVFEPEKMSGHVENVSVVTDKDVVKTSGHAVQLGMDGTLGFSITESQRESRPTLSSFNPKDTSQLTIDNIMAGDATWSSSLKPSHVTYSHVPWKNSHNSFSISTNLFSNNSSLFKTINLDIQSNHHHYGVCVPVLNKIGFNEFKANWEWLRRKPEPESDPLPAYLLNKNIDILNRRVTRLSRWSKENGVEKETKPKVNSFLYPGYPTVSEWLTHECNVIRKNYLFLAKESGARAKQICDATTQALKTGEYSQRVWEAGEYTQRGWKAYEYEAMRAGEYSHYAKTLKYFKFFGRAAYFLEIGEGAYEFNEADSTREKLKIVGKVSGGMIAGGLCEAVLGPVGVTIGIPVLLTCSAIGSDMGEKTMDFVYEHKPW